MCGTLGHALEHKTQVCFQVTAQVFVATRKVRGQFGLLCEPSTNPNHNNSRWMPKRIGLHLVLNVVEGLQNAEYYL